MPASNMLFIYAHLITTDLFVMYFNDGCVMHKIIERVKNPKFDYGGFDYNRVYTDIFMELL